MGVAVRLLPVEVEEGAGVADKMPLGLEAAEARSRTIGQTPCLIVKRYDRQSAAGEPVRRLHQEDFCQAMGFPPARKYQQEGGPSLRDCFAL
ncbi:MAG: HipA domain-containing protein, partial [Verrucomicrobia bacterium]|nr:HipA domain-containing protein [Verrucomicrobiota bacterium]